MLFYVKFHVSVDVKQCACFDRWFTDINLFDPEDSPNAWWREGSV